MTRLGWNDPKRTHPCDLCGGRRYVGAAGLKAHRIVAHGPNPYECQGCQQRFKFRGDLERHMDNACPARVQHTSTVSVPTQPPAAALPVDEDEDDEEDEDEEEEKQFVPHLLNSNGDVPSVKQEIIVEDDSAHPIQSDLESEDLAEPSIEMINPTLTYNGSHVRDISMDGSTIALSDTDRQASTVDIEEAERAMAAAFKILAQTAPTKWTPPNVGAEVPIEIIREVAAKYKVPVQEIEKPVMVKEEPVIVTSDPPSLYSILTSPFGQSLEMSAFTLFLGLVLYFSFTIPAASITSTVTLFIVRGLVTILTTTAYHLALASVSMWTAYVLVEMSAKAYHKQSRLLAADGLLQLAQHGIADRFSAVSPSTQTQDSVTLNISCGVCSNPPTELTATTCGHLFCRDCVVRSLDLSPLCPTCEKEIDPSGGLVEICI